MDSPGLEQDLQNLYQILTQSKTALIITQLPLQAAVTENNCLSAQIVINFITYTQLKIVS